MPLEALTYAANLIGAALLLKMLAYRVQTIVLRRAQAESKVSGV